MKELEKLELNDFIMTIDRSDLETTLDSVLDTLNALKKTNSRYYEIYLYYEDDSWSGGCYEVRGKRFETDEEFEERKKTIKKYEIDEQEKEKTAKEKKAAFDRKEYKRLKKLFEGK
tara:strand:+ start:1718 stop:2065 length:348 start_codon:yes stop_codon:yes gene_type:complete